MILGLRQCMALVLSLKRFGQICARFSTGDKVLTKLGLIECDEHYLRLSAKGLPLANLVFAEFLR